MAGDVSELSEVACAATVSEQHQDFPIPVTSKSWGVSSNIFLKVHNVWDESARNQFAPCVVIVEKPKDCVQEAFPLADRCDANVLWNISKPDAFLAFQLPRPDFTMGEEVLKAKSRRNHSVCWRCGANSSVSILGRLDYYTLPKVDFSQAVDLISVRTFLNPGWRYQLHLACANCSSRSGLAVRPPPAHSVPCAKPSGALASAIAAVEGLASGRKHRGSFRSPTPIVSCPPPSLHGPCWGYAEQESISLAVAALTSKEENVNDAEVVPFSLGSDVRLSASQRQRLFRRKSALCFYPDLESPQGWLVGYVEFHMDSLDVQAFMSFVCFFGMALPLICMITVLLHVQKNYRCKKHIQEVRLLYQREQLDMEMSGEGDFYGPGSESAIGGSQPSGSPSQSS
eukprot:TRINITY_DN7921_c1_g1_i1.p1 TRINITY_DN7921_c1_g1~~TRINITY_DN7921_c1_g1_i1.p1  ORF type:complete len:410 (+),score=52.84 TRINITY_DN7921_c1_g1_i1:38-1231(+)